MKKAINKLKSNSLFTFILGGILFGSIGIYGINEYNSNSIEYSPTDENWEVSNVNEAINSLYSMKTELDNLKGIGDATTAQILSGKKALVKGNTITGTMTNRGTWTNTPTSSGKVTIPAGYHNGSGYVDTSKVYDAGYNTGSNLGKYATNTLYPKQLSTWIHEELGFKPKILIVYFYWYDTSSKTIKYSFNCVYSEALNLLDGRYVRLTDTGFDYKVEEQVIINGKTVYVAYG